MGTISKSLKSLSSYPIPSATIEEVAEELGLNQSDDVTHNIRNSNKFKLAKAGIYDFLSEAPNISQAGISYNFSCLLYTSFPVLIFQIDFDRCSNHFNAID